MYFYACKSHLHTLQDVGEKQFTCQAARVSLMKHRVDYLLTECVDAVKKLNK